MLVEGIVYFESGIQVTFDCLGKTFTTQISGIEVEIHFPQLEILSKEPDGKVLAEITPPEATLWPPLITWFGPGGNVSSREEEMASSTWGHIWIINTVDIATKPPSGHAIVKQARLTFRVSADESSKALFQTFIRDKLELWELVKLWIQAISFQHIDQARALKATPRLRNESLWYSDGQSSISIDTGDYFYVSSRPIRSSFTPKGLTEVFRRASAGLQPELSWQILNDAHQAQGVGDLRRACVDAATALEIGAERWIEERLEEVDPQIQAIMNFGTLGPKITKMKTLGWDAPANIDRVIRLRNESVHQGLAAASDDVDEVLSIVLNALKSFYPEYKQLINSSLETPSPATLEETSAVQRD